MRVPSASLLLVDLQRDFLERPGLHPEAGTLCRRIGRLLAAARRVGLPIAHAQTVAASDGSDRMPHWQGNGVWQCIDGTDGALPPLGLEPLPGELVLRKRFFSAFGDARLEPWLRENGTERLLVAGIYLHGCVRATVLDAYERGFEVVVVEDAVGTTDVPHGEVTRVYLDGRAARFVYLEEALATLDGREPLPVEELPVARIDGAPRRRAGAGGIVRFDPCRSETVLWRVPRATATEVGEAARICEAAGRDWSRSAPAERAALLEAWAGDVEDSRAALRERILRETAKPSRFVDEEIGRAVAHIRLAASLARELGQRSRPVDAGVEARRRPLGVVGLVTPWNNPVAIPAGKIAPALAFGNSVVWKPSPEGAATALALAESLSRAGCPAGLVNVVLGDDATARDLCREARIAAVSVTGSHAAGVAIASHCAAALKPFQAELGGNNAAIVLADADLEAAAGGLARAAFGFAGQRCTALRRIVVERRVAARFTALLCEATATMAVGDPRDASTEVGPLISSEKRDRVRAAIERAVADGARLLIGGVVPPGLEHGAWLAPAVLAGVDPRSRLAQEETFGPLAVLLEAEDLDDALALANGVPQGLVLAAYTSDEVARARLLEAAEAGIVHLRPGPLVVHPAAPFVGWKASGFGPPEHGDWDADFYSRTQAVYTDPAC